MRNNNRIAVFGAGAVGCFLGAELVRSGQSVCLIGRDVILDPVCRNGLKVIRQDEPPYVIRPLVSTRPEDIADRFDIILLTVKSFAVGDSIPPLATLLNPDGLIVSFQNGVGTDDLLIDHFGPQRCVGATLTCSVGFREQACVECYTTGGGIAWCSYETSPTLNVVEEPPHKVALPILRASSPQALKWSKLVLNCVGSAQCAILDTDLGSLLTDNRLFAIERMAMLEALAAMNQAGTRLIDLPGFPVRLAATAMRMPRPVAQAILGRRIQRGRGGKSPTLRRDAQRGGPTENAYLNGAVVRLARGVGVPAPVNEALSQLVDEVTRLVTVRDHYRNNSLALLDFIRDRGIKV